MRFIYTDEAGTSANEPVCVVAAVIVDGDNQLRSVEAYIEGLNDFYVPSDLRQGFRIHATDIYSGRGALKRDDWPIAIRITYLKELLGIMTKMSLPVAFGLDFKKTDYSSIVQGFNDFKINGGMDNNKFSHYMAFVKCMERSDLFLRKYLAGKEVGTVIAEDIDSMREFLKKRGLIFSQHHVNLSAENLKQEEWKRLAGLPREGHTYKIEHIVHTPHFVKKDGATLLQLADLAAFTLRRFFSKKPDGEELLRALLGVESQNLIDDPVWFTGYSSGLFNTRAYWSTAQIQDHWFNTMKARATWFRI